MSAVQPTFTVIQTESKLLMTPREFAKFAGMTEHEVRANCKSGKFPHQVRYTRKCRPYYRILVQESVAIIKKECMKNAPRAPRDKPDNSKIVGVLAAKVISKVFKGAR